MPEDEQLEYRFTTETDIKRTIDRRQLEKKSDDIPMDTEAEVAQDTLDVLKKSIEEGQKALRAWKNGQDDIKGRLEKFKGNEYPRAFRLQGKNVIIC